MRFAHYNRLAKEIEKEINNVDGIIITHGTDTLAITSAALAFCIRKSGTKTSNISRSTKIKTDQAVMQH